MGSFDANFNPSIYAVNYKQVIAMNPQNLVIINARIAWQAAAMAAGTVVARRTSTGFFVPYVDGQSDGVGTAAGVVLEQVDFGSASGASGAGTNVARVTIGGATLYTDALVGMDAAGLVDLKARVVIDASSVSLTIF